MPITKRIISKRISSREDIAKRVEQTREARGFSASEFARLVGVTPTAVWNWEKNSTTPRRPALEQIAKVLGVSIDYILTGEEGGRTIQAATPTPVESVSAIIDDARARLALSTGVPLERIKLNVNFLTE